MNKKQKTAEVISLLKKAYPVTGPFLDYSNPLELVVATALSAQCTDERVNMITAELFKKYKIAQDYADADLKTLESEIYSAGFYRNKAKNLKGMGQKLVDNFDGRVPEDFEALQTLPGVAKKTAAIVMAKAFNINDSVAVDTHVFRIARLLEITKSSTIEGVRRDLNGVVPREDYLAVNELMITHGRAICVARRPDCSNCVLRVLCPGGKKIS